MTHLPALARALLDLAENGRLADLLLARGHSPYLARQRLDTFLIRIRLVTVALAALTLCWIPLDALTLPAPQWQALALLRSLAAMVFLALGWQPYKERSRLVTLVLLALMLAVPLAIYAASQHLLNPLPLTGAAAITARLYQALPWIVLAGLSIFPLVAAEGLALVTFISSSVLGINLCTGTQTGEAALATLLIMLLVSGAYLLACAIQLHYMMALLRRACHDPLTGALTRRSGVEMLAAHWRTAVELEQPLAVLFLDADNFKALNDQHGHEAGDIALQTLVQRLQDGLRRGDLIVRWGGEEFLVVLIDTPMAGAQTVLHHICRDGFGLRPDGQPLTASIGLAERVGDKAEAWQELVDLADQRMYAAKAAGKACCVCGEAPPVKLQQAAGEPVPDVDRAVQPAMLTA